MLARLASLAGAGCMQSWMSRATAQAPVAALAPDGTALKRSALVIGNTSYVPARQSIPSSRKNVADVANALAKLGFEVRRETDQGADAMRGLIRDFFGSLRSADGGAALAVFYYTGHGMQHLGENYIVPADVSLEQKSEGITKAAINIDRELFPHASLPNDGTAVLIFDACRNDPSKTTSDPSVSFNQVNPPRGTVITFSTAAGRYAIAPKSPDLNSVYTQILVDELERGNSSISIKDFLDAVKFRVKRFMETNEDQFLRKYAQDPEVAANLRLRLTLALQKPPAAPPDDEQSAWARIEQTVEPEDRAKLLEEFVGKFKDSRFLQAAEVQRERAKATLSAMQRNRVRIDSDIGDIEFRTDQAKALDGDKDAAFRVSQMFERGSNGVPRDEQKMVQWLRHASELRNGIASYQLYLHYRDRGMDREAVRYENRARELGYTPPPRLDTRRG